MIPCFGGWDGYAAFTVFDGNDLDMGRAFLCFSFVVSCPRSSSIHHLSLSRRFFTRPTASLPWSVLTSSALGSPFGAGFGCFTKRKETVIMGRLSANRHCGLYIAPPVIFKSNVFFSRFERRGQQSQMRSGHGLVHVYDSSDGNE